MRFPAATVFLVPYLVAIAEGQDNQVPNVSAKSCSELGWDPELHGSSDLVCADTELGTGLGSCKGLRQWTDARDLCIEYGARLCTLSEIMNDETRDTGCGVDDNLVWSSTPCDDSTDTYALAFGSSKFGAETSCSPSDIRNFFRCCADVHAGPVDVSDSATLNSTVASGASVDGLSPRKPTTPNPVDPVDVDDAISAPPTGPPAEPETTSLNEPSAEVYEKKNGGSNRRSNRSFAEGLLASLLVLGVCMSLTYMKVRMKARAKAASETESKKNPASDDVSPSSECSISEC
mmetsp:Transcript_48379/g.109913  ORF Transcript_48379/g.109913 Transcript_48379/m.109913 type:complete len:290 (-) Transcript_48379:121-990(-)|eukprot:CAMPEP_0172643670 /NCGR_PEP_ID=MMETSP1068-20121228/237897_1 /TAXON_ID=35684 /ORGANISM="Pseudopedinella elastica, Strain CCMP716" /LENGTH=289 /DNA_ID=CAMNT_0013457779 /DNA_START=130 /DNA_END=999 /DNA_ORIENTATION=-